MPGHRISKHDKKAHRAALVEQCTRLGLPASGTSAQMAKRIRVHVQIVDDAQYAFMLTAESNVCLPLPRQGEQAPEKALAWH